MIRQAYRICPACSFEHEEPVSECQRCGIDYTNYSRYRQAREEHQYGARPRFPRIAPMHLLLHLPLLALLLLAGYALLVRHPAVAPLASLIGGAADLFFAAGRLVLPDFGGPLGVLLAPLLLLLLLAVLRDDDLLFAFAWWWQGATLLHLATSFASRSLASDWQPFVALLADLEGVTLMLTLISEVLMFLPLLMLAMPLLRQLWRLALFAFDWLRYRFRQYRRLRAAHPA